MVQFVLFETVGNPVELCRCPTGLFLFNGSLGFRSEYGDDAYCLDSGEYFWGGASGDRIKRNSLMVQPMQRRPTL